MEVPQVCFVPTWLRRGPESGRGRDDPDNVLMIWKTPSGAVGYLWYNEAVEPGVLASGAKGVRLTTWPLMDDL